MNKSNNIKKIKKKTTTANKCIKVNEDDEFSVERNIQTLFEK